MLSTDVNAAQVRFSQKSLQASLQPRCILGTGGHAGVANDSSENCGRGIRQRQDFYTKAVRHCLSLSGDHWGQCGSIINTHFDFAVNSTLLRYLRNRKFVTETAVSLSVTDGDRRVNPLFEVLFIQF